MSDQFNEIASFVAVARHRSFVKAANERGVTSSALSHAVNSLERRLGVRLLNRTTRSVSPTEAGSMLLSRIGPLIDEMDRSIDEVCSFRETPRGTLRLNLPRSAGRIIITPLIRGYMRENPDVKVELVTDDGLVDIVEAGFDAGLRFGEAVALDMVTVPLTGSHRFALVASPELARRHDDLKHPVELAGRPCICRRFPSGTTYDWEFTDGGTVLSIKVDGPLILDDDDLMVDAAAEGVGFAFVHERYALASLAQGRLVRMLEPWCQPFSGFSLYYSSRKHTSAALRRFIDWSQAQRKANI